jgi:hypothetical protein
VALGADNGGGGAWNLEKASRYFRRWACIVHPQLTALAPGLAAASRACSNTASCAGQPEHGRGVSGRRSSSLSHEPPMRSGKVGRYQGTLTWGTFLRDITYGLCARSLAQSGKDRNPGSLSRPRSGSKPAASSTCQGGRGVSVFCPSPNACKTSSNAHALPRSAISRNRQGFIVGRWTLDFRRNLRQRDVFDFLHLFFHWTRFGPFRHAHGRPAPHPQPKSTRPSALSC